METVTQTQTSRGGRGAGFIGDGTEAGKRLGRNKQWIADHISSRSSNVTPSNSDGERRERGGYRGSRARGVARGGRRFPNATLTRTQHDGALQNVELAVNGMDGVDTFTFVEPEPESPEDREKFYQELVKAREVERKKAIAEGKMDDPLVPKRLEDAITMVGTCLDMCPPFERYRRERESSLSEWETIPGTKRVDHKRAVKMYERGAGDKTLPSDLRPPVILKKTLDYLFHDLLPRGGFPQTAAFIRDRSRAVRNDFTMQHETGALAMECHDRCARFHILALHYVRDHPGFSVALEEQQLMNTLQSLKEFYHDQRGRYQSPSELEMRVYHRLIHIRDQKERHDDILPDILEHPVFKLTTSFRRHVQIKSAPIGKNTPLLVGEEGMQIFGELAAVLRQQGSVVMIYLVACLLENLFGRDAIEDIESIRGHLTISEMIDGNLFTDPPSQQHTPASHYLDLQDTDMEDDEIVQTVSPVPIKPGSMEWLSNNFGTRPSVSSVFGQPPTNSSSSVPERNTPFSAFSSLTTSPNPFGPNAIFGAPVVSTSVPPKSVFPVVSHPPDPVQPVPSSSSTAPALPPPSTQPGSSQSPHPVLETPSFFAQRTSSPIMTSFSYPISQPKPSAMPPAVDSPSQPPFPTDATRSNLNPKATPFTPTEKVAQPPFPEASFPVSQGFGQMVSHDIRRSSLSNSSIAPVPPVPPINDGDNPGSSNSAQPTTEVRLGKPPLPERLQMPQPFFSQPLPSRLPSFAETPSQSHRLSIPSSPPSQPPPLKRKNLISLPSTPTASSPLKLALSKSVLDIVRNQEFTSSSSDLLSPLLLPSPSASPVGSFINGTPSRPGPESPQPASRLPQASINGRAKRDVAELQAIAMAFAQKSLLVKNSFRFWLDKMVDRAAWLEACEHSDAHRSKIRPPQASPDVSSRRKRSSSALFHQSPQRRTRRRISGEYKPPRTDEELAERFKQNQEEHARRWAKGSFLQITRKYVETTHGSCPENWMLWLSMNPENDGTAIWLECKFNVPDSGHWEPESIFSIPLSGHNTLLPPSPGLIVFECTPLEGVTDDLERKFRVLDDCARLREIIKSLPPNRHFVPSLLVLRWTDAESTNVEPELVSMITNFIEDSMLDSYHTLCITSAAADLDAKYRTSLESLALDVEGKLVQTCTLSSLFQQFRAPWTAFALEWVEKSLINGDFDWSFYAQVLEICVELLNEIAHMTLNLVGAMDDVDALPFTHNIHNIADTESCYTVMMSWLESTEYFGREAESISNDLLVHRNMGHEFPTTTFLDHLGDLTLFRIKSQHTLDAKMQFCIPKTELTTSVQHLQQSLESHGRTLTQTYIFHVRRSPKRRFASEETTLTTMSSLSKRRRLSVSANTSVRDERSPTPPVVSINEPRPPSPAASSVSTIPSEIITVSMLRALTKDIRKKYGSRSQ